MYTRNAHRANRHTWSKHLRNSPRAKLHKQWPITRENGAGEKDGVAIVIKNRIPIPQRFYRTKVRLLGIRIRASDLKRTSLYHKYIPPTQRIPNWNSWECWELANPYISLLRKNLTKLRCADNNGQLSRNDTNQRNLGTWTIGETNENLNSIQLSDRCGKNDPVARNTLSIPENKNSL